MHRQREILLPSAEQYGRIKRNLHADLQRRYDCGKNVRFCRKQRTQCTAPKEMQKGVLPDMYYIVLDLEWNQPWPGSPSAQKQLPVPIHGEIIQIGAVRMLEDQTVAD